VVVVVATVVAARAEAVEAARATKGAIAGKRVRRFSLISGGSW
jgi:hypothetical protein